MSGSNAKDISALVAGKLRPATVITANGEVHNRGAWPLSVPRPKLSFKYPYHVPSSNIRTTSQARAELGTWYGYLKAFGDGTVECRGGILECQDALSMIFNPL